MLSDVASNGASLDLLHFSSSDDLLPSDAGICDHSFILRLGLELVHSCLLTTGRTANHIRGIHEDGATTLSAWKWNIYFPVSPHLSSSSNTERGSDKGKAGNQGYVWLKLTLRNFSFLFLHVYMTAHSGSLSLVTNREYAVEYFSRVHIFWSLFPILCKIVCAVMSVHFHHDCEIWVTRYEDESGGCLM